MTQRPHEWDEAEAYFTPLPIGYQGLASLASLMDEPPRVILDIGAGAGGLGQVARSLWPSARLVAVEIRGSEEPHLARHYDEVIIGDATSCQLPHADLVIGNPAFSLALPLATRGLRLLRPRGLMSFVVRQTLGDAEPVELLLHRSPPLAELTVSGRVSMAAAGESTKDQFGYQWFVWDTQARPRGAAWSRVLLPRLDGGSLGWTARPGTGALLAVDDDLVVDLRTLISAPRQQLTRGRLGRAMPLASPRSRKGPADVSAQTEHRLHRKAPRGAFWIGLVGLCSAICPGRLYDYDGFSFFFPRSVRGRS